MTISNSPPPLLRIEDGERLQAHPAPDTPPFESFGLPPLPMSLDCWLLALVHTFYRRHQRCFALLLMLDAVGQRWRPPRVPVQRCCTGGVSWTLDSMSDEPPHLRIGGSYQSGAIQSVAEAESLIPPFDGIHIVVPADPDAPQRHWFLRADGMLRRMPPEALITDDWANLLNDCREQFELI